MKFTAASLCMAALLCVGTYQVPSQTPELQHASLGMTSGDTKAWTGGATAPTGVKVILAGRGIQRG